MLLKFPFKKQPPEVFCKKGVLKNFANLTKRLQACNFIKKRIQNRCFLVKFAKFLRTPILKNMCERLLLKNFDISQNSPILSIIKSGSSLVKN